MLYKWGQRTGVWASMIKQQPRRLPTFHFISYLFSQLLCHWLWGYFFFLFKHFLLLIVGSYIILFTEVNVSVPEVRPLTPLVPFFILWIYLKCHQKTEADKPPHHGGSGTCLETIVYVVTSQEEEKFLLFVWFVWLHWKKRKEIPRAVELNLQSWRLKYWLLLTHSIRNN